jgi:hypothetical protein
MNTAAVVLKRLLDNKDDNSFTRSFSSYKLENGAWPVVEEWNLLAPDGNWNSAGSLRLSFQTSMRRNKYPLDNNTNGPMKLMDAKKLDEQQAKKSRNDNNPSSNSNSNSYGAVPSVEDPLVAMVLRTNALVEHLVTSKSGSNMNVPHVQNTSAPSVIVAELSMSQEDRKKRISYCKHQVSALLKERSESLAARIKEDSITIREIDNRIQVYKSERRKFEAEQDNSIGLH